MNIENMVIEDVLSVVTVYSPKGRVDSTHERLSYALSFTTDGQITYTHKGKNFISDKYSAVILPKGQTYDIKGDKEGIFPVINFECNNLSLDTIAVFPIKNSLMCRA